MQKQKQKNPVDYFDNEKDARFVADCFNNREKLEIMIKANALEAKNGQVVFHFDSNGKLRKITAGVCLYQD